MIQNRVFKSRKFIVVIKSRTTKHYSKYITKEASDKNQAKQEALDEIGSDYEIVNIIKN